MTDFLNSLSAIDRAHPATQACEKYLTHVKGLRDPQDRCLGFVQDDDPAIRLYYYRIEDGILEIETRMRGSNVSRQVTDFITDPADVQEMLGSDYDDRPKIQPSGGISAVFSAPR